MTRFLAVSVLVAFCSTLVLAQAPLPSPYGRIATPLRLPPSTVGKQIVDQRLLDRVAEILNQGGDGSENSQEQEQDERTSSIVDSDLFDRIARIISQNEGQLQAQTPISVDPQPKITADYGVPKEEAEKLVGGQKIQLGQPERARRIASFSYRDDDDNSIGLGGPSPSPSYSSGGYSNSNDAYPAALPSQQNYQQQMFGIGRIMFISDPTVAESIAAFDIPENNPSTARQARSY